ncbi:MAG: hypothetical protein NC320_00195 [Clostridium sp.]|nr:hypothetical protein [Clostridium sp.]MCM1546737.1 hypothetical protein [Ruminococcus sp.]
MKKTFFTIFSIAMICCLFTACGKDENSGSSTTESTTMAQDDSSGINSATDASQEAVMNGATDKADTSIGSSSSSDSDKSDGVVDDLVSDGEDIVSDAGSAVEDAADAFMGDDSSSR